MTRGGTIARRYARALLGVGHERGSPRDLLAELDTLAGEIVGSEPLRRALFAPIHPRAERKAVLGELARRLDSSADLRAFVHLLVDENRTSLLPQVLDALRDLVQEEEGRIVAKVTTARPLESDEVRQLRTALSRRVGARVTVELEVDPEILGGVVARVGDLLLDGSVRTQLASLAESLRRGSS